MASSYIIIIIIVILMRMILYFVEPLITRQKIKDNHEHGSARWATKKEIKENFHKEKISSIITTGFPVYYSRFNIN